LLGKFTDHEVAEKSNRTLAAVRDRRKFLGKPAVGHAPQPVCMEREPRDRYTRLFATKSDRELRALLGWSSKRVARDAAKKSPPSLRRKRVSQGRGDMSEQTVSAIDNLRIFDVRGHAVVLDSDLGGIYDVATKAV
jgi:hypothetical protein